MSGREQTRRFLQQVAQSCSGFWEIRFLQTGAPSEKSSYIEAKAPADEKFGHDRTFTVDEAELEKAVARVHALAKKGYTCYVSMNPRTVRGGTTKAETKPGQYIVADFDSDGLTLDIVRQRIITSLTPGVEPTIIVETSPGHFQCWLLLSELPATAEQWVALQKGLSGRVDSCKGVHSIAQPMRICGVPNLKKKYKDKNGKSPLSRLIAINPDSVFEIGDMPTDTAAPSKKLSAEDSVVAIKPKSLGDTEKAFLDTDNVPNSELKHDSRNMAMRFSASGMKARGWPDDEIKEKLLAAADARGIVEEYSRRDCLRQIENGINDPSLEPSAEETIEITEDDDEPSANIAPLNLPTVYPKPHKPHTALSHGLLGDIISSVEPHTEGDSAVIGLSLLTQMGNMAGKTAYVQGGAKRLYQNLYLLIIGDSSTGAKGDGAAAVNLITQEVDPYWVNNCIPEEVNSGEGLKKMFADDEGVEVGADGTVSAIDQKDKRRFVHLEEFAACLTAGHREGSTLSSAIRKLFDCPAYVEGNTSKDSFKGRDPYLSLQGHITPDELERKVSADDCTNGFMNRFIACYSEQSKMLPHSGNTGLFNGWTDQLQRSLKHMSRPVEVFRDEQAAEYWEAWYLSRENTDHGIVRTLVARDRPLIAKLSLTIALLNRHNAITLEDLVAAFQFWRYSCETWRYQFGLFNQAMTDRVLGVLNAAEKPLNYEELVEGVGKNVKPNRLNDALHKLRQKHAITCRQQGGEFYYSIARAVATATPTDEKDAVVAFVKKNPSCNKTKISRAFRKLDTAKVLAELVSAKRLTVHPKTTKGRPQSVYKVATAAAAAPTPSPAPKAKASAKRKSKVSTRAKTSTAADTQGELFSNNGQAAGEYEL